MKKVFHEIFIGLTRSGLTRYRLSATILRAQVDQVLTRRHRRSVDRLRRPVAQCFTLRVSPEVVHGVYSEVARGSNRVSFFSSSRAQAQLTMLCRTSSKTRGLNHTNGHGSTGGTPHANPRPVLADQQRQIVAPNLIAPGATAGVNPLTTPAPAHRWVHGSYTAEVSR